MNLDAQTILKRRRFEELMQAGREAYKQGQRRLAHDHWHEAATVDPYNEHVWLSLFRVLETDDDRIACLENIIAINPMNVQARQRLRAIQHPSAAATAAAAKTAAKPSRKPAAPTSGGKRATRPKTAGAKPRAKAKPAARPRRRLGRIVAIVVVAVIIGLMAAVAISVLLNNR